MKLNILKIILWPKNNDLIRREIDFRPGMINIITGQSGTGKSSLTSIIDYCLGSEKCTIPVGIIRELTAWYGVLLKLDSTELLLARQDPEDQQATDAMYWIQGNKLKIPAIITAKNTNRSSVKAFFNQLCNLPQEAMTDSGWGDAAPSFRDMAAFNFQPQHIVANPYTLFFKADTTEHREKLKVIFPLVLGAMTSEMILLQREQKDLEKQLSVLSLEINSRKNASEVWLTNVETYYIQAQGFGLIHDFVSDRNTWQVNKYVEELRQINQNIRMSDLPSVSPGVGEEYTKELQTIINKEDLLSQEVGSLTRRLAKISQLNSTIDSYRNHLGNQSDRLKSVGWLKEKLKDTHVCPVCEAHHQEVVENIKSLFEIADEFSDITQKVQQAPSRLEIEMLDLKKELREKEQALSAVSNQRQQLESRTNEQAKLRQRNKQIYFFAGKIEQALENIQQANNSELIEKCNKIQARIDEIRSCISPGTLKFRRENAIESVSRIIETYAKTLKLEHSDENVKLNIKDLTVEFKRTTGRTDYLWEVGSGQNWVGYHIAALLAIHEYIRTQPNNPVPSFLLIDQPSQVYFPESSWESISGEPEEHKGKDLSADIMGVQRIFTAISEFLEKMGDTFQVIITEHAGEITWKGAKNINIVGNWRDGCDDFLIPAEWLSHSQNV